MVFANGNSEQESTKSESTKVKTEVTNFDPNNTDISAEITVWGWSEQYKNLVDPEFNKVYPNIHVNFVNVSVDSYIQKLQSALATGTDIPDVINGEIATRGKIYSMGILANLEEPPFNLDKSEIFDYVVPSLEDADGNLVSVDQNICAAGFAYKRDLAKKYLGTDDPDEIAKMIATWDDFITVGKKVLKESNGKVKMLQGFGDILTTAQKQNLVDYVDGDTIDVTKALKKPLEIAMKVRDAGILNQYVPFTPSWNVAFSKSDTIFFPATLWTVKFYCMANDTNGKGNWGMTKVPEGGFAYGGTAVGVYKDSKNLEAAFDYVNWVFNSQKGAEVNRDLLGCYLSNKTFYSGENAIDNIPSVKR
jgi:multiple sugar transport system substrate-binding protein